MKFIKFNARVGAVVYVNRDTIRSFDGIGDYRVIRLIGTERSLEVQESIQEILDLLNGMSAVKNTVESDSEAEAKLITIRNIINQG